MSGFFGGGSFTGGTLTSQVNWASGLGAITELLGAADAAFNIVGGTGTTNGQAIALTGGTATNGTGGAITLTSADGVGSNKNGGDLTLTAGASTGSGTSGNIVITGGAAPGTGTAGDVALYGGTPTAGQGGAVGMIAGPGVGTNKSGGGAVITAGASTGSANGNTVTITGGRSSLANGTAAGGDIVLTGGAGGGVSGSGGSITLAGGTPIDGVGGAISITASNGVGTNRSGGAVTITTGSKTGSGTAGAFSLVTGGTERMNVTGLGVFRFGVTTGGTVFAARTINIHANSDDVVEHRVASSSAANSAGNYAFARSRNTIASPTVVQSGDLLGYFSGQGYIGATSTFIEEAAIRFEADGAPADNSSCPGRIGFLTVPSGSLTNTERWRIDNAGNLSGRSAGSILTWTTALGAISHLTGPSDQTLALLGGGGGAAAGRGISVTGASGTSASAAGGAITISAGASATNTNGANVTISSGAGGNAGGTLALAGGAAGAGAGVGGPITLTGGASGGANRGGLITIQTGNSSSGSGPGILTLQGGSGVGSDIPSSNTILSTGLGTGAGLAGNVQIQTGYTIASSSTAHTRGDRHFVSGSTKALADNTLTSFASLSSTSDSVFGGTCSYTVRVTDSGGAESCVRGSFFFAVVNKAGTVTTDKQDIGTQAKALNGSTDAVTTAAAVSGTNVLLQVTSDTSLTQVLHDITYTIQVDGPTVITPQ